MDWIVLTGVKPWDGRYEFDVAEQELTTREWGYVKRLSGYMPLTIEDGLRGGDPELFAVFAAIALRRAGKIQQPEVPDVYERLIDNPAGATIRLEADQPVEEDAEASPPPAGKPVNGSSSGTDSPTSSASSDELIPPPTGIPALASSPSRRARLGT
jgi:hypothetical protein